MVMAFQISPKDLDAFLMQSSPVRLDWDESIDDFLLVKSINQSARVVSLGIIIPEKVKKRTSESEENKTELILYSSQVQRSAGQTLWLSDTPVPASKDKCELFYFLVFRNQGFFGPSSGMKNYIYYLLRLSDCLLAKNWTNERSSRHSRSYSCEISGIQKNHVLNRLVQFDFQ